ncbi:MAG: phosphonate metabolism protein/1,5-bisphosphokinase (PRPP-forming) PhnN [Hylemonella sp.]|nr:phosphonate metabolism protein/1,5-bisphosphokinase (PRPP-forming) PhnN [Hylemonella sp.]
MRPGLFVLVVGPSGAGKDTLLDGARAHAACAQRFHFARRVITRPAGSPGEDHDSQSEADFAQREEQGGFLITWRAHGLSYGLPSALRDVLDAGGHVLANGSRAVVAELARRVPHLVVVEVTAASEVLAQRIAGRGRESREQVLQRLARKADALPSTVHTLRVYNDGTPAEGVDAFVELLLGLCAPLTLRPLALLTQEPLCVVHADDFVEGGMLEVAAVHAGRCERLRVPVVVGTDGQWVPPGHIGLDARSAERLGAPAGAALLARSVAPARERDLLRKKIGGEALTEGEYRRLMREVVDGRFERTELAAFLVSATQSLSDGEVQSLARARAALAQTLSWDEPMVVDKHAIGGVPGSRITLIVVPIVAAFGLAMPKTSSRAITSAAGTADAMETLARVDLTAAEVAACVRSARACIAWNGRLNHSVLDDVMNAITRPLGLDSARWAVASILSKKKAAGATHVVVDLPCGPRTKLPTEAAAHELAHLFERTGRALGLEVRALVTDGSRPIGRGVGPALEVRDVLAILGGRADAAQDLRAKAALFASHILAWHPEVGSLAEGHKVAQDLLDSGAALQAFEAIIDAQGRRAEPVLPGSWTHEVLASHDGRVEAMDGWAIAGLARAAGAPTDLGAGVDLLCEVGQRVARDQPILRIHASSPQGRDAGQRAAEQMALANPAILIGSEEECLAP